MKKNNSPFSASSESLEESLLPRTETEADVIFGLPTTTSGIGPAVKLGSGDLNPVPGREEGEDIEEQGMIMGPSHPIFHFSHRSGQEELPVPPGAKFDPISPVGPGFYSPGDPDFDDLLPPNPESSSNPLGRTVRPPNKFKSGSSTFRPQFHPHGAPPGAGNPPFFM